MQPSTRSPSLRASDQSRWTKINNTSSWMIRWTIKWINSSSIKTCRRKISRAWRTPFRSCISHRIMTSTDTEAWAKERWMHSLRISTKQARWPWMARLTAVISRQCLSRCRVSSTSLTRFHTTQHRLRCQTTLARRRARPLAQPTTTTRQLTINMSSRFGRRRTQHNIVGVSCITRNRRAAQGGFCRIGVKTCSWVMPASRRPWCTRTSSRMDQGVTIACASAGRAVISMSTRTSTRVTALCTINGKS